MKIDYDEKLSPHFTVGEMLRSGTAIRLGIKNVPEEHLEDGLTNEEVVENLRLLAVKVLEPLRQRVGRVIVTSGYRCGFSTVRWAEWRHRSTFAVRRPTFM